MNLKKASTLEQKVQSARHSWKDFTLKDFQNYYNAHFQGMSRIQVRRISEGTTFYQIVYSRGLLDDVFPASIRKYAGWTVKDFRNDYQQHFNGMNRADAYGDKRNGSHSLYMAVRRRGLLNEVFPKSNRMNYCSWKKRDFQQYYQQHFPNWSRAKMLADTVHDGRNFYHAVNRRGWVKDIFPQSKRENYGKTLHNYKQYYRQHFPMMGRSEVRRTSKKGGNFYSKVHKMGWADQVFPPATKKPNGYYQSLENVQRELEKIIVKERNLPHAKELQKINGSLYGAICLYHGGYAVVKTKLGYVEEEMKVIRQLVGAL